MSERRLVRVAAIQMNSRDDKEKNLIRAEALIDQAADLGAQLVTLPEFFNFLGPRSGTLAAAEPIPGPTVERLQARAQRHRIVLHGGSIPERLPGGERAANTSVVLGPDGALLGTYRKIHLFDVDIAGAHPYRESDAIAPGDRLAVLPTPLGRLGLTVCYDVRFPELYRALTLAGAELILVPAAFTLQTGKDHWEVLLRARAIENQVFVLAPAQFGSHPPDRACFGNAMVIDPWGTVLARAPEQEAVVLADLDLAYRGVVAARVPCLHHRRPELYA